MKKALKWIGIVISIPVVLVIVWLLANVAQDIPIEAMKAKYANAASQFVDIDGMNVHFRDEKSGTVKDTIPLVLIHGTGASLHTWEGWVNELSPDFRIISLDLPAYGLTGPNATNSYPVSYYVQIVKELLEKRGVKKCYIAGNSLGGSIAWQYTLKYPEMVSKLILVDAAGYPMAKPKSVPIGFALARTPVLKEIFKYVMPRSLVESSLKNVFADDSKVTAAAIDRNRDMVLRAGNREAFVARMNMPINEKEALWSKISTITIPVLIQWGKEDNLITTEVAARFHDDLPNDTLIVYGNAGHIPMEEIPIETARDVKRFLKSNHNHF
jgi:pimeloyl-ACP methyl ester carboxylesterase